ncbi:MAG: GNAT family N-acetyltransferase, partial [Candidatus Moranbacteria bacterium]|nr:GNAT family N-acetyltransferase [Candidatus Moranbacteria bacterium]
MAKKKELNIHILFAEEDDLKNLYAWRNDPITRRYAFNSKKIKLRDHKKWFMNSLKNPKRQIFILLSDNLKKIGQVRFDIIGKKAEIDIAISPEERGKGYGSSVLKKITGIYLDNFNVSYVIAKIKHTNIPSI